MSTLLNLRAGENWEGNPVGLVPRTMFKIYDSVSNTWKPVAPKMSADNGATWTQPNLPDSTWTRQSPFDPYIAQGSVFTRIVENMPVHSNSDAMAVWMQNNVDYGGFGPTSINTSVAGTHPIACYLVDSTMPNATFQQITVSGSAVINRNQGTVVKVPARQDTVNMTINSPTIVDSSITAADIGRSVFGTGIPTGAYVGTVTPGVGFLLSSSYISQINIFATATRTNSSITIFDTNYPSLILEGMIPWPAWLTPAYAVQSGQDSSTAIFDVGTGILREYYLVSSTGTNTWSSSQAGFSIMPKGLDGWTALNYPLQFMYGFNAAVWMHNHLGFIGISEARNQQINHTVAFTFSNCAPIDSVGEAIHPDGTRYQAAGPCWPALSCDGTAVPTSDEIPMEGQWATLPDTLDLSPTGPYPPFLRMVIKAVQTYGMVGTDKNLFVHAFNTESGVPEKEFFGVDPWSSKGDVYNKYLKLNNAENRGNISPFDMSLFPWDQTIWAPRNWGSPT